MDKLSKFYFELATDAEKMKVYSAASINAKKNILNAAGITSADAIISLSEEKLAEHMANLLVEESSEWKDLCNNASNNSNNNIGMLGR